MAVYLGEERREWNSAFASECPPYAGECCHDGDTGSHHCDDEDDESNDGESEGID